MVWSNMQKNMRLLQEHLWKYYLLRERIDRETRQINILPSLSCETYPNNNSLPHGSEFVIPGFLADVV